MSQFQDTKERQFAQDSNNDDLSKKKIFWDNQVVDFNNKIIKMTDDD